MNYQEAKNYILNCLADDCEKCKYVSRPECIKCNLHIAEDMLQELIDNYNELRRRNKKLEKGLDYLLNYLDGKHIFLDNEKQPFTRKLQKEVLIEDIAKYVRIYGEE